ncbi:MAG TPA: hypothetical protein DCZ95_18835 [Verrucomicrobia bacterium]|nr:MAG: hypothetical protein A2X46_17075 [Lentisphaerae bacterium GWF2_57_35]HBA86143.1 hypothetical protein [Verrucomicrobiota bacterium]
MFKKSVIVFALIAALFSIGMPLMASAQEQEPAKAGTMDLDKTAADAEAKDDSASQSGMGLWTVIISSGWLGVILWLGLGGCSIAAAALAIDSFVTIREKKIAPDQLVSEVRSAMEQGDVMKALKQCEAFPTPLANILSAGFSNVKEGFDSIQDIVSVTSDLESEKLMQRVAYLNVCANIAPMLGLLGTVQGMIYAFASLATTQAGAAQQAMLAMNIAQALWTTAAGLCVAIPAVTFYTFFKNRASKIVLGMEGLTMDLIKSLRNVEVVEEG